MGKEVEQWLRSGAELDLGFHPGRHWVRYLSSLGFSFLTYKASGLLHWLFPLPAMLFLSTHIVKPFISLMSVCKSLMPTLIALLKSEIHPQHLIPFSLLCFSDGIYLHLTLCH